MQLSLWIKSVGREGAVETRFGLMIIDLFLVLCCLLFPVLKTQGHWALNLMIMWALAGSTLQCIIVKAGDAKLGEGMQHQPLFSKSSPGCVSEMNVGDGTPLPTLVKGAQNPSGQAAILLPSFL